MEIHLGASFFKDIYNRIYLSLDAMTKSKEKNAVVDKKISNLIAGLKLSDIDLSPRGERELRARFIKIDRSGEGKQLNKLETELEKLDAKLNPTLSTEPGALIIGSFKQTEVKKALKILGLRNSLGALEVETPLSKLSDNPMQRLYCPELMEFKKEQLEKLNRADSKLDKDEEMIKKYLNNEKVSHLVNQIDIDTEDPNLSAQDLAYRLITVYEPLKKGILFDTYLEPGKVEKSYGADETRNLSMAIFYKQKNDFFPGFLAQLDIEIEKQQNQGRTDVMSKLEHSVVELICLPEGVQNLVWEEQKPY